MDVGLPDGNGFDFVSEVLKDHPRLPVLMVSAQDDRSFPERARACGARGFIDKAASLERLVEAVSAIQQGGSWFTVAPTALAAEAMINEGGALRQPST